MKKLVVAILVLSLVLVASSAVFAADKKTFAIVYPIVHPFFEPVTERAIEYGKENVYVVHMDVPPEVTIERNSKRRICEKNRHPIKWTPKTKDWTTCPEDGSPLISRGILDDPETIKVRLKEYQERTEPVLKIAEEEFGLKPAFVDGQDEIAERLEATKKAVGL